MKCPYCETKENGFAMIEEDSQFDPTQDQVEIVLRCTNCGERFHGTLSRSMELGDIERKRAITS